MRPGPWPRLASIVVLTLTMGASECSVLGTDPEANLAAAREKWERRGPDDYSFTLRRSCECLSGTHEPAVIVVRDCVVESRTYVWSGSPVPAEFTQHYPAIEELFDRIGEGLTAEGNGELSVDYHPLFGYPTRYVFGDPATDAPVTFAEGLTAL